MENGILADLKNEICFFGISKKMFYPNENQLGFHMRNRRFLHKGWFLQNLEKYFIPTSAAK
jgi:hypothetical protein